MTMLSNSSHLNTQIGHAVQWAEGMMLAPQHFQQEQVYSERQRLHLMAQCQPYYWGINRFEVDATALLTGLLSVRYLHAVMPDGLVVQYDSTNLTANQQPLTIDLNKIEKHNEKAAETGIMVYLTVPIRTPDAASSSSGIKRFESIEDVQVMDENSGDNRVDIYRLQPKVALFAGNIVPDKYIRLPLVQINLQDNAYQCTSYRPPSLRINFVAFPHPKAEPLSSIGGKVQQCLLGVRKKASKLAQLCNKNQEQGDGGSLVTQNHINIISHMVSNLFELEVLLDSENAHPFLIYQGLAKLVGQLAPLSKELVPAALLKYQHDDCMPGFTQALDFIERVLDDIHLIYSTVFFNRSSEGVFELELLDKWKSSSLLIEFTPRSQVTSQEMTQWVNYARIASKGLQQELSKKRILGCEAKIVDRFSSINVSPSNGSVLIEVTFDESLILTNQNLQISCAKTGLDSFSPRSAILYLPHELQGQKMPEEQPHEDN